MSKVVTEMLQLDTIIQIDPRIEQVFQYHVERSRSDCMNRPADKTPRKVVLEFMFEPVMDPQTRECEGVNMTVQARSKVPDHASSTYRLGTDPKRKGLLFNVDLPESIVQTVLFPRDEQPSDE